jgi:hypothetical protein
MSLVAKPPLASPTDLGEHATRDIAGALNALLADTFALYLKTAVSADHILMRKLAVVGGFGTDHGRLP